MADLKIILTNLALYYGGEYTEGWQEDNMPFSDERMFKAEIRTPRTVFNNACSRNKNESDDTLMERVRGQLLWVILQKGVEYVNEQSDIYHMFNPDKRL